MSKRKALKSRSVRISAIDLFCGAGGLTHGLKKEGIDVVAGYDIDGSCDFPFTRNNSPAEFIGGDVAAVTSNDIVSKFEKGTVSLLAGCAPCQAFSTYTQGLKPRRARWKLLDKFADLVVQAKPDIVTMENVSPLEKHGRFRNFVSRLEAAGYKVSSSVVQCADYGLPQYRRRLVLLASRLGKIDLLTPQEFGARRANVRSAIGKLPRLRASGANKRDRLHRAASLTEINRRRVLASKPGGTWRDWPKDLMLDCHKKESGATFSSIYGRMEWNKPSPTITTLAYSLGSGRFGHPTQTRALSLREAAILQSFPRSYKFVADDDDVHFRNVCRLIGNAVPVLLGRVIGRSILRHVKSMAHLA